MNFVPKMNLIRVEKVHLKNTEVLKKNLFVILGNFIKYVTSLLERIGVMERHLGHFFFWSGVAFLEQSGKKELTPE